MYKVNVAMSDEVWIDAATYEDRWTVIKKRAGEGGQGIGHLAERQSDGVLGFIKILKEPISSKKKIRFLREAKAYQALAGKHVPRLIESNTDQHLSGEHLLYIATEYIDGPTLRTWFTKPVTFAEAVRIALSLLEAVNSYMKQACSIEISSQKTSSCALITKQRRSSWTLAFRLMPRVSMKKH